MFRLPWSTRKNASAPLALALQGGGAHGAYTWGVLDRLLEAGVPIEGISGTSAGAMNAVALAEGWTTGGADGARAALDRFWTAVGDSVPFHLELLHNLNPSGDGSLPSPMNVMLGLRARVLAVPAQPLRPQPAARRGARAVRLRAHPPRRVRSSSSSPPPPCARARSGCSAPPSSAKQPCWPRPACPPCTTRWRSTASTTGTAASPPTRRSTRCSTNATRRTC